MSSSEEKKKELIYQWLADQSVVGNSSFKASDVKSKFATISSKLVDDIIEILVVEGKVRKAGSGRVQNFEVDETKARLIARFPVCREEPNQISVGVKRESSVSAAPDRERSSAGHAVARQNDFHQVNSHQTSNHQANSHTIVKKARVKKLEDEGVPVYKEIDAEISECGESSGPEFPDFNARRVATTIDSDLLASMAACFCKVFDGEFSQVPTITLRNVITEEVGVVPDTVFSEFLEVMENANKIMVSGDIIYEV